MDINYKILWFEDTDEAFDTLSRRTKRYVESKNLRCTINRVYGTSDFDISTYDLNSYEILVVDLRLSEDSKGSEIIKIIRDRNYVNDILFYSAEGLESLDAIMKKNRLEGVFISDRNHKVFLPKIQQLVDKSIRRSENVINIRGIVMDETSDFDSQMCEIAKVALNHMTPDEIISLKNYLKKLLSDSVKHASQLENDYQNNDDWEISSLLQEHDFSSMMKVKTLNFILKMNDNNIISNVVSNSIDDLPQAFHDAQPIFVEAYSNDIIQFRNKLAHVKNFTAETPVFIGTINGEDYYCDSEFCSMLRQRLIQYDNWFNKVYKLLADI